MPWQSWNSTGRSREVFERYFMVGYSSTFRKAADRMSLSRCSSPVSMEDTSMLAITCDSCGFSASTIAPSTLRNLPLTLAIIRCRTLKETSLCTGSIVHVTAT